MSVNSDDFHDDMELNAGEVEPMDLSDIHGGYAVRIDVSDDSESAHFSDKNGYKGTIAIPVVEGQFDDLSVQIGDTLNIEDGQGYHMGTVQTDDLDPEFVEQLRSKANESLSDYRQELAEFDDEDEEE